MIIDRASIRRSILLLLFLILITCTLPVSRICSYIIDPVPHVLYNTGTLPLVNRISIVAYTLVPAKLESSNSVSRIGKIDHNIIHKKTKKLAANPRRTSEPTATEISRSCEHHKPPGSWKLRKSKTREAEKDQKLPRPRARRAGKNKQTPRPRNREEEESQKPPSLSNQETVRNQQTPRSKAPKSPRHNFQRARGTQQTPRSKAPRSSRHNFQRAKGTQQTPRSRATLAKQSNHGTVQTQHKPRTRVISPRPNNQGAEETQQTPKSRTPKP